MSEYLINDQEPEGLSISFLDNSKCLPDTTDKYIRCKDCDASFLFSKEEQNFFCDKKLEYTPSRCHNCRVLRRASSRFSKRSSVSAVVCISCKSLTYVPFKPKGHSPVYCRYCMHKKRA
ncbi:MAG: zinc-ribbon domain containing protein [Candidatus Obscuribacterales bacterium]|nr:zinc-ribbon domain containing protein [Cyanobacteria bacterium HKST-UBA01]MCB9470054.1 zinc-ribbon domain containing protein [Candidatus Obscuribacterales bacterium]